MKRLSVFITVLLVLATASEWADAQNRKAGINAAAFLKVGVGARQVGLGSATTSLAEDVTNMFWNPAGVALKTQQAQVLFTYNKWLGDLKQNALAASYDLKNIGTIGVGVMTFGVSDIKADRDIIKGLEAIQIDQATSATYDYMDFLAQVTFARYVADRLSLGATLKYINEKIDDRSAHAIAFDFGSVYHIDVLDWNIGARISNLGGDIKFYDFAAPIPLTFAIGTSLFPYQDADHKIMLAADAVKPQDGLQYYYTGAEYTFKDMISLRGGYKFNYSGVDDGGTSFSPSIKTTIEGFSLGAGAIVDLSGYKITVDYAFTKMDLLDNVHRVSLRLGWK